MTLGMHNLVGLTMELWDGTAYPIAPEHERYGQLCDSCATEPARHIDDAGEIWCWSCLEQSRHALGKLAAALNEVLSKPETLERILREET